MALRIKGRGPFRTKSPFQKRKQNRRVSFGFVNFVCFLYTFMEKYELRNSSTSCLIQRSPA